MNIIFTQISICSAYLSRGYFSLMFYYTVYLNKYFNLYLNVLLYISRFFKISLKKENFLLLKFYHFTLI